MKVLKLLETDNINFIRVSADLVDEYLELVNDKSIQKWTLTSEKEYTKEKELAWIQNVLDNDEAVFSMLEKKTGKFIGNASLESVDEDKTEIAISIRNDMQGMGYGIEAIKGLIRYSKEVLNLKELIAVIFSNNERSLHCFKKLGFKEYKRNADVKKENGELVADVYLKLEL